MTFVTTLTMGDMPTRVELAPRQASSTNTSSAANSVSGMLSTLIPSLLLAMVWVGLFLVFRRRVKRVYQPRTYLGGLRDYQKTPVPSQSMFGWIGSLRGMADEHVLNHHSIDGFLWLRFFKIVSLICLICALITWPILMPVYGTSHGGQKQFNKISYSNINSSVDANRLYAPLFIGWIILGFIMFVIGRESIFYIHLQQAFLLTPNMSSRMSTRTVLFTDVPSDYLNEERLRQTFSLVKHVWIATDTKQLEDLVEERDKTAMKLEGAEIKLSKNANSKRLKAKKNGGEAANEDPLHWVDENKRPTHKLGFMGLIGKKVDTIDWCRGHLETLIPKVESMQGTHWNGKANHNSAVFIEFENLQAAEAAYHLIESKMPKKFQPRTIGARPREIIWKNLNMSRSQRMLRTAIATALIVLLIVFWTPITFFIGSISNINYLTSKLPWLDFINHIPTAILGVVTGLLPVIILAVVLILVPIIIRALFKLAGAVALADLELKTQTWYFVFQVVQVFLVVTLASGASAVVEQIISQPGQAATLLAENLPSASNFYINYLILQGLAIASKSLFNLGAFAMLVVVGRFLDTTPRKKYNRYTTLSGLQWGSTFPVYTNLAVIAITYSCIAPLMLAFAAIAFFLMYLMFRYNLFYVMDTLNIDTRGRTYGKALQQLTTGVYLAEACLIGLFIISSVSSRSALGPLVLMILFLVATVLFHVYLNRTMDKIQKNLGRDPQAAQTFEMADNPFRSPNDESGKLQPRLPSNDLNSSRTSLFVRLLHVPAVPPFAPHLQSRVPEYSQDNRREAYLAPSITSPSPLLWIVHDEMGLSKREKEATGKVIGISDTGAWWDEGKGSLKTIWEGQEDGGDENLARQAPIYEEKPEY